MKVKSFDQLSEAERQKLYQFVVQVGPDYYFSSYGEMLEDYLGFLFSQGKGHFSLWKGKDVIATAGVITEEIAQSGGGLHYRPDLCPGRARKLPTAFGCCHWIH